MLTGGEQLAVNIGIAALVVAIVGIPLALWITRHYYNRASKETADLIHDLDIVKSHGLTTAIIEQNQVDDPKSVKIVEKPDKRLAREHTVSFSADAILVRERAKVSCMA